MTDTEVTPLFVATPDANPTQAVVLVQEAFGVTSHIQDVARRAAAAGYYTVAPHLFHRSGDPVFRYDDYASVAPVMAELSAEGIRHDLHATLDHVAAVGIGAGSTAIVGFCMGGAVALWAAASDLPFGAAVTFYGGGLATGRFGFPPLLEVAAQITTPWLGLYGDEDTGIPTEDVERLREAAATAPADTEIVRYPGAQHGFHCDDRPANFDPAAAVDGWRRTLAWLSRYLE